MQEKEQKQVEYRRIMQDIEEEKQYLEDYEEWSEKPRKTSGTEDITEGFGDIEIKLGVGQTNEEEVSFYKAFEHFQVENGISENNEEIFYGSVFHDFNEQWQGSGFVASSKTSEISKQEKVDFSKLSLEERAKLLPAQQVIKW